MKTLTHHTPATVHIRQAAEGQEEPSRTIEGYAILFDTPSAPLWSDDEEEAREQIAPEAITREFLDGCDIKMTINHDFATLLARSKNGQGTLTYDVDTRGVHFTFEAPRTDDGDRALELVRRGDIDGCSFMFTCPYRDPQCVERTVTKEADGKTHILYTVRAITAIYDFTLTPMPAYPDTTVSARTLRSQQEEPHKPTATEATSARQVNSMRAEANRTL